VIKRGVRVKPSLIAKISNVRVAAFISIFDKHDFYRASSAPYGSGFVLVLHEIEPVE